MGNRDFFDEVFESPEDDPLLGNDPESPSESSSSAEPDGVPFWMEEEEDTATSTNDTTDEPKQRKIIITREDDSRKLDELTQAIRQGWEMVRLSVGSSNDRQDPRPFVVILEQHTQKSLFDF